MAWNIIWTEKARKDLKKMERKIAQRIYIKIMQANENDALFLEQLEKQELFKYMIGDYRALINKLAAQQTLAIITIKHRKDAYKNL